MTFSQRQTPYVWGGFRLFVASVVLLYVATASAATNWITTSGNNDTQKDINRRYSVECLGEIAAVNCHLRSKHGYTDETTGEMVKFAQSVSPAIDAGDPASEYRNEPAGCNGRRANLGFYGNTPWATRSAGSGIMVIVR